MSTDAVNETSDGGLADAAALAKAALAKVAALEKQLSGNESAETAEAVSAANGATKSVVTVAAATLTEAEAKKILAKYEGKRGRRPAEFYEAQKLLGTTATEATSKAETAAATEDKEPMSEAKAKKLLAQFEGKRGRRPAEFYEAQKLLGVDSSKPKAKKDVKIIVVDVTPEAKEPMSENKAKKILAQYAGKRGRRPAEYYEAQKVLGVTDEAAPKAKAAPKKTVAKAETTEPMSENKAKKILAQFEGKRGRRPAEYYEAQKVLGAAGDSAKKGAAKTPAKKQKDAGEMTLAEAKKILAQYAGKRGRRPEAFYQAEKLVHS